MSNTQHPAFDVEMLEGRTLMAAAPYYSLGGSGNNLDQPGQGKVGSNLVRIAPVAYGDGISTVAGAGRLSAREISNLLHSQAEEIENDRHLTAWIYAWGQFIFHDMGHSPGAGTEPFMITVPTGDPSFDPLSTGTKTIPLTRAGFDPSTGTDSDNPRQHPNFVSSYLDGSMVYGSTRSRSDALRTFSGGLLKTSEGNLPPFNTMGLRNDNDTHVFPDNELYVAGDVRINENIELTSVHALFIREHNRLAAEFAAAHPEWDDDKLFKEARRIVIAEIQHITYAEYLPALMGESAIAAYTGYDNTIDATTAAEFSAAAFRMGHTQLGGDVEFFANDASEVAEEMPFRDAFTNPAAVQEHGIDSILKYLSANNAQEMDLPVLDEFRNFLFGPPGSGGLDLVALDIQRGRDMGLSDYNSTREAYGLKPVKGFKGITSDVEMQKKLKDAYGSVDNIDLFTGGLAEDHLTGSSLGPTFTKILVDQFTRTRDGDRLWHENSLNADELAAVRRLHLSDLLKQNTELTNLQTNVFFFKLGSVRGHVFDDSNGDGKMTLFEKGRGGVKVQLIDLDGDLYEETTTNSNGAYSFNGLSEGDEYRIRIVKPGGATTTERRFKLKMANTEGASWYEIDFGLETTREVRQIDGAYTYFWE
jgi:hypothetical protein